MFLKNNGDRSLRRGPLSRSCLDRQSFGPKVRFGVVLLDPSGPTDGRGPQIGVGHQRNKTHHDSKILLGEET